MLSLVKLSLRITTTSFDSELNNLIAAAELDLGIAGVVNIDEEDTLIIQAVTTYVKMHFGEPDNYDRLKKSYDEQKAQLSTSTTYNTEEE